jgi:hypothetical protein
MKFVFLTTHLGSNVQYFGNYLNKIPGFHCKQSDKPYTHPLNLENLRVNYAHTVLDILNFNHSLASTSFYECCQFIYVVRDPRFSLGEIVSNGYSKKGALNYYLFRLRRMYEMSHYTPGAVFLTYDQLFIDEGREVLGKFFGRDMPKLEMPAQKAEAWIPNKRYKEYLSKFQRLDLLMC